MNAHPYFDHKRRTFLKGAVALSAAGVVPRLMMTDSHAAGASGYRALVNIFLLGGNDSNNMIVPITNSGYAPYYAARADQSQGGLALPQSSLLPLVAPGGSATYGFHPAMSGLQGLWQSGALAAVLNVGSLITPLTQASYSAKSAAIPVNLFSHLDQQRQAAATALPGLVLSSGWGGRMLDQLGPSVGGSIPAGVSVAGNSLLLTGNQSTPVVLPQSGGINIPYVLDSSSASVLRKAAIQSLDGGGSDAVMVSTYGGEQLSALALSQLLNPVLTSTTSSANTTVAAAFAGLTSSVAQQLAQIARVIGNNAQLGNPTRQVFYAGFGSFDTHGNQITTQAGLLGDLSAALTAFYNATVALGVADQVTSFTLSDFTRTLKPATDGGSDHAWGGHHLVVGGAVKGQTTYGTFPQLDLGGPDDATDEGRWIPTIAIDQYAATLGTWLGLSPTQLASVLPNLHNFSSANLGFLSA